MAKLIAQELSYTGGNCGILPFKLLKEIDDDIHYYDTYLPSRYRRHSNNITLVEDEHLEEFKKMMSYCTDLIRVGGITLAISHCIGDE